MLGVVGSSMAALLPVRSGARDRSDPGAPSSPRKRDERSVDLAGFIPALTKPPTDQPLSVRADHPKWYLRSATQFNDAPMQAPGIA